MSTLSKAAISTIQSDRVTLPSADSFHLPERVLQFGTGVLLRGLPDYYIDKANKQNVFNGRVLVVKSTSSGGADAFSDQDGLYTLCIKGIEQGEQVVEYTLSNAISRVVAASHDWPLVLDAAANPDLEIVISNTTEAGIVESDDRISDTPPSSFPGKLLAFLYQRYQHFEGDMEKGLVILPTELITDNASKLKSIVHALAAKNKLEHPFIEWLEQANHFCNTLVDRIVPGRLPKEQHEATELLLGYTDQLMIMAEPFSLWAIETDSDRVKKTLSFAAVDKGIVMVPSIEKFKEIKLRLLNGTHTLSCAAAICGGFQTVKEAMQNDAFKTFVERLMLQEIGLAIQDQSITASDVREFSASVIDRFSNPYLEHRWENIAMNYTAKMAMRNIPLLEKWYQQSSLAPQYIALGFAAYLIFMETELVGDKYVKKVDGQQIALQDEFAPLLFDYWKNRPTLVKEVLRDQNLWGKDLSVYEGFEVAVQQHLEEIQNTNVNQAIEKLLRSS